MKDVASIVGFLLLALVGAVYTQEGCQEACCDYDYKASDESCCKYWVCANGVETEMTCPGGLHWNEKAKACDWPASANCGGGEVTVTNEPVTTTNAPVTTTDAPVTTTDAPIITTNQPVTPTKEPGPPTSEPGTGCCECTSGEYQAIEGELCKYQVCDNGKWTNMTCPGGLVWNNSLKTCAWQECENCGECTNGQYEAVDSSLCKYRVCNAGSWITMNCPSGLLWDNTQKSCVWGQCDCTSAASS